MKTASLLALASLTSLAVACGGSDGAVDLAASTDAINAAVTPPSDLLAVKSAFNLKDGKSAPDALRAGDCYRVFVAPVEGIPMYLVKEFANGAVIFPNPYPNTEGKPGPMCVDIHEGATKISFNGVMLDAVARWGLGHFKDVTLRPGPDDEMDVNFTNGAMRVYRDSKFPAETGRYRWAKALPTEQNLITAAPSIGGGLLDIRLDGVRVTFALSGHGTTQSLTADAPTVLLAYRHAWASTKNPHSYAMNDDVIGVFNRTASIAGDAGGQMQQFDFTKSEIRKDEYIDPTRHFESIDILPPQAGPDTESIIRCTRDVPENHAPPPYACTGPGFAD